MNEKAEVDQIVASARVAVLTTIRREPSHQLGRRGRVAVAAVGCVALAAALSGAAIAVVQASRDDIAFSVACYGGASLTSPMTTVVSSEGVDNETGETVQRQQLDPLEACGAMWRMGILGQDKPTSAANDANFPIPELTKCTLTDGVVAVFAREGVPGGNDFCLALGLQP